MQFGIRVDGEVLHARHPEQTRLAEGKTTLLVADTAAHVHFLDVRQINDTAPSASRFGRDLNGIATSGSPKYHTALADSTYRSAACHPALNVAANSLTVPACSGCLAKFTFSLGSVWWS